MNFVKKFDKFDGKKVWHAEIWFDWTHTHIYINNVFETSDFWAWSLKIHLLKLQIRMIFVINFEILMESIYGNIVETVYSIFYLV